MSRDPHPFYVPPERITRSGIVDFDEEETRHIERVVRLRPGDLCRVVDGVGGRFRVRLESRGMRLAGRIEETTVEEAARPRIELVFPILRHRGRTEWMIEKAVEVGVDLFTPFEWKRSARPFSPALRPRWERIIREAMKQSERAWLPELRDPMPVGPIENETISILADPEGMDSLPALDRCGTVRLVVGPEGGPDPVERESILEAGSHSWNLGPTRLRAETAAVVGSHRLASALRRGPSPKIERKGE